MAYKAVLPNTSSGIMIESELNLRSKAWSAKLINVAIAAIDTPRHLHLPVIDMEPISSDQPNSSSRTSAA
jgi:hypothetical protein